MDTEKPDLYETFPEFETLGENLPLTDVPEDLEYQGSFVASAVRCRELDWRLAAVDARELVDLEVNFEEPVEIWLQQCSQVGPLRGRVSLGVHTGSASELLVLEVENGEGKSALDQCGSWRSSCLAQINGREQHYYTLPPGSVSPPTRFLRDARVMVYGEEGLAPLPPSVDLQTRESWRWITPPWEASPPDLPLSLWTFLQQASALVPASDMEPEILSREEVYRLIIPHEQLLKVLQDPFSSLEDHYNDLLDAALEAGFHDEGFLLSLLWNAPQGDVLKNPEREPQLIRMVREAKPRPFNNPESPYPQDTAKSIPEKGVLISRSRYELILGELRRLKHKAAELEAALLDWGENLTSGPTPATISPMSSPQVPTEHAAQTPDNCPQTDNLFTAAYETLLRGEQDLTSRQYSQMNPKPETHLFPEVSEATMSTCLQNNPDLARDPARLQMVQYCFKNYVNIDPDLSNLSLPERLERASQMAREFLKN